jgi:septum formation protein
MGLILASTSEYRKRLLERLGIPFRCVAPKFDESKFVSDETLSPAGLARQLATEKVMSLIADHPDDTIVGGDQLVDLDGRIIGKPGTIDRVIQQLKELSGRSHRLATAVAVWDEGRLTTHVDISTLTMRTLDLPAIHRYVMADKPVDCAGSYMLEARGIALFERVETDDYTAVIGMPLMTLTTMLKTLGYTVP